MEQAEHYFTGHTNARLTFIVGVVIGVSIMTLSGALFFGYLFGGGTISSYAIAPLDSASQILTEPTQLVDVSADTPIAVPMDFQVYGAKQNYAVTLVQYVDYECRFCKKYFPDLLNFVDQHPDQIRFMVKHYPLVQIHPAAKTAAVAAHCAGEQGQFIEYSSRLFSSQSDLGAAETFTTIADTLPLDSAAFADCRAQPATLAHIEADAIEATNLGIQSQPNLIVWYNDGTLELIDGYVNISYIEQKLQSQLTSN